MPLPRISSRTPLREPSSLLPSNKLSTSMSPLSMRLPGKFRSRTGLFALVGLVCISIYLILAQHTSFSPSLAFRNADTPAADQLAVALETIRNSRVAADAYRHRKMSKGQRPQLHLTTEQELAAVSSFLASLPQNVIPLTVDPSRPIDPQLVLDFDTMSVRAPQEVEAMVEDVWTRNPIFLYSKLYSPVSREIKATLAALRIFPAPMIIDVDIRDDAEVLKPLIERLTSAHDLPVLLIGGKSAGTIEEIRAMHKSGALQQQMTEAGAVINGARKKKHRK